MADIQTEKAFQKQGDVFLNSKKALAKKKDGEKVKRFSKKIGLGFKTPQEAKDGVYIDKKCPFTSSVSIRGRIFKGVVLSNKMHRTVVLRRDYLHYIKKIQQIREETSQPACPSVPSFPENQ